MKTTQIRLHKFLIDWLKSNSKAAYTIPEIKRNIVAHGVIVSGVLTHSQLEWVFPSQTIELNHWPSREPGDLSKIKIGYEDVDCLVINKPVGLVVEPGAGHPHDNVVSWLLENYPEQDFKKLYGEGDLEPIDESEKYYDDKDEISIFNIRSWAAMTRQKPKKPASNAHLVVGKMNREHQYNMYLRQEKIQSRPYTFGALAEQIELPKADFQQIVPVSGLVHRLDKDTQGLLLIAKNLENLRFFQDQFRTRSVVKKYLAVVDGMVDQEINIENWQIRSLSNPIEQRFFWTKPEAMVYSKEARRAESIIKPLFVCSESNQSIIEIQIKTGRMHQIRIQCLALGFPLSNDKAYNLVNKIGISMSTEKSVEVNSHLEGEGTARFPCDVLSVGWQSQTDGVLENDAIQYAVVKNEPGLTHSSNRSFATLKMTAVELPKQFHNNPTNSSQKIESVIYLNSKLFQTKQKTLFGEGDYCLLSNQLEIKMPSGDTKKFEINKL